VSERTRENARERERVLVAILSHTVLTLDIGR
jgi:hypothetical protein